MQVLSLYGDMSGEHAKWYGTKCTHLSVCMLTRRVLSSLTKEAQVMLRGHWTRRRCCPDKCIDLEGYVWTNGCINPNGHFQLEG